MSFPYKSHPCVLLVIVVLISFINPLASEREYYGELVPKRVLEEQQSTNNQTMILAAERTQRRDPFRNYETYYGGWNLTNKHYWGSVVLTGLPFFAIAIVWFGLFAVVLLCLCICRCCCKREPYGYSRVCYALSLILLIFFTIAAICGAGILYTGNGRFTNSMDETLGFLLHQTQNISDNLEGVSSYLDTAKTVAVNSVFLPPEVMEGIDKLDEMTKLATQSLQDAAVQNKKRIHNVIERVGLSLIILAAILLGLAFLGFLFSVLGLSCCVYSLVICGWIIITLTLMLCGIFLLIHIVIGDACVAMEEWTNHPTGNTALDDILPCLDNATAYETKRVARTVTYQLTSLVDNAIANITNKDFPPQAAPLYFNQSGPLMPLLCNPYNADLSEVGKCMPYQVELAQASAEFKKYVCEVSASNVCKTPGRLTPQFYNQLTSAIDVTYGLYHNSPFLLSLGDCSFVRETFVCIHKANCPGLQLYTKWVYTGLVVVSGALMLSMIFWIVYARERKHRIYTRQKDGAF